MPCSMIRNYMLKVSLKMIILKKNINVCQDKIYRVLLHFHLFYGVVEKILPFFLILFQVFFSYSFCTFILSWFFFLCLHSISLNIIAFTYSFSRLFYYYILFHVPFHFNLIFYPLLVTLLFVSVWRSSLSVIFFLFSSNYFLYKLHFQHQFALKILCSSHPRTYSLQFCFSRFFSCQLFLASNVVLTQMTKKNRFAYN